MMHTITLSCSSSPSAVLFPQTLTGSWFTSIHHRYQILFSETVENIFWAGGLYKRTPLGQMKLLHKSQAMLFLCFLLPLLLTALIFGVQCCLPAELSKPSQTQPKEQKGICNMYFRELHQGRVLPFAALMKLVLFFGGNFIIKMTSKN